ncbi:MAG: four helix bundle protein [Bacteroidales bacterium]|nr:four helix bundle protein [Bacteroidales bacterium]
MGEGKQNSLVALIRYKMNKFRFQSLEIWQDAIDLGDKLFDIADIAQEKKLYRFAEQLRGSGLSVSNNIAEGSGSFSDKEFAQFLNISRRSVFECANLIIIFNRRELISPELKDNIVDSLCLLSKRITTFRKKLIS